MEHPCSSEAVTILHTLNLGQHTLLLMSDGGINLLTRDEQTPSRPARGIRLDSMETYRLFISLQEQFKQEAAY